MIKPLRVLWRNPYFTALRNIRGVLDYDQKKRAAIMLVLLFFNAIADFAGLAVIAALMVSALQDNVFGVEIFTPEMADSYPQYVLLSGLRWLYDWSNVGSVIAFLFFLSIIIFLIFIVKNIIHVYITYIQVRFGYNVALRLNRKMFKYFYDKGYLYIKDSTSGKKVYSIVDVPMRFASNYFTQTLSFTTELVVLIFIAAVLLAVDPIAMVLVGVTIVPTFVLIYSLVKNNAKKIGYQRNEMAPKNYAKVFEAMNGFVDVKLSNTENEILEEYTNLQRKLNRTDTLYFGVYQKVNQRTNDIIFGLGILVIFGYAYFSGMNTETVLTLLGLFAISAYKFLPSVNRMMTSLLAIKNSEFVFDELNVVVNQKLIPFEKAKDITFTDAIELDNVSYHYPNSEKEVLDGISLTIKKGESVGIIGSSGSGKTTLLKLMLRLFHETKGSIKIDGQIIKGELEASYQKLIGYVEQDIFILNASLRENVAFGAEDIDDDKVWRCLREAKLDVYIKEQEDGINMLLGENGVNLSGGQKQRVGIARALYKNSEILFFDEATSALDNETERAVVESINHLSTLGKTIIIVAHRITTLEKCDRIVELAGGRIIREPDYDELIKEKILQQ